MFDDACSLGSLKAFAADGLSAASSTDLGFFGFSHCWVFSWVFSRCFLLVVSFMYILL